MTERVYGKRYKVGSPRRGDACVVLPTSDSALFDVAVTPEEARSLGRELITQALRAGYQPPPREI